MSELGVEEGFSFSVGGGWGGFVILFPGVMGAMLSVEAEGVDELQQEPEVAPCHPSSSPLSPHVTYLGPSVRVSDPYNILNASSRLQSMVSAASSPPNWVSGLAF